MHHWSLIEADLHERYGIDLDEPGLLESRTWRWLVVRIEELLTVPPHAGMTVVPATRIGFALNPPKKKT